MVELNINIMTNMTKETLKTFITQVLIGDVDRVNIENINPNLLMNILKEMGCDVDRGSFETNGWDYDYWFLFDYNDKSFTVYGGGYYGKAYIEESEE